MELKDLTKEQKKIITDKYEALEPKLIELALYVDPLNGYEYVDLGEAGIWAKYPIGVTEWNEESLDKIKYFQWGDTVGYTKSQVGVDKEFSYSHKDYKFSGNRPLNYGDPQLTKYCTNAKYGENKTFTDNLTVLLPEDDACTVNMGGNWRMPTKEDFEKLMSSKTTNNYHDNYNGVPGLTGVSFHSKSDYSKHIFLPTSGYCADGSVKDEGAIFFWSSSLNVSSSNSAYNLKIYIDYYTTYNYRYYGYPIIGILNSN